MPAVPMRKALTSWEMTHLEEAWSTRENEWQPHEPLSEMENKSVSVKPRVDT